MGFFHQIHPPPTPAHGNLAPEQVCVTPQGAGGNQHQPSHLLPGAQISAASKFAASALGNFGCGLLEATAAGCAQKRSREALAPLSQCCFVGWVFFFYCPKALKALLYYHWVLPAIAELTLDASMVLLTEFSLWEASQACSDEATLQMGYSSIS